MDMAIVLSVVKTIRTAIQTLDQSKEMFSFSHFKSELECLQKTVNAVQSVLEDADAKQGVLNRQQMNYIEELKDAVYDANDVLDEFVTLVKQKQLTNSNHHKYPLKVTSLLSRFNHHIRNMSNKVMDVNKKLDAIASNSSKFMFKIHHNPSKFTKQETSSFVSPDDIIIGREEDLEKIVWMLLDSEQSNNMSSIAIVGMGGLGKTAFAQLVYNDPRIAGAFQLKSWTCVADQDQWDLTNILGKILKDLHVSSNHDLTSLEQMQRNVCKQLGGRKYLLVLDDVWTESYNKWQELASYLMVGESGSRIIVTTRSKTTAGIVGGKRVHELQGLSEEESWCLFQRTAFGPQPRENLSEELVKLGKEIVKKCINIPLAIRVVGSLLHGESKPKWLAFRDKELANISENDDTMYNILSLSYHQLDSSLKSCFAYCAIFPKDFEIDKKMLIRLWMAQGYINEEYSGEECFRILLQRCFFQDVVEDNMGEIVFFKLHDLLHDIAKEVAGLDICILDSGHLNNVHKKVRHLALLDGLCPKGTINNTHIRTCLQVLETRWDVSCSDKLLSDYSIMNWRCLRSLELSNLGAGSLPESVGKLFHLRYLDLSRSQNLKVLPSSITNLVNLQTLILYGCGKLKELPNDLYNLVELTTLDISYCTSLSHRRSNLGMSTNLQTLGRFVVGGASSYEEQSFDGLKVLRSLSNLKGYLQIIIEVYKNANYNNDDHGGGNYLMSKQDLSTITIEFENMEDESIEWEQSILEDMQPHHNIKQMHLKGYNGETLPRWPKRGDNSTLFYLPNLVYLTISNSLELRFLPSLEELPNLKNLELRSLPCLKYVVIISVEMRDLSEGLSLFPCLERLIIHNLSELKGWWPGSEEQTKVFSCFAQLEELEILECSMLNVIPICSSLKMVSISDSLRDLKRTNMDQLPYSFKSLLPPDSNSRLMAITDFERLT